jgi:hypothetical protein
MSPRAERVGARRTRKRRDAGSVRLSERDLWLLALVGEQYAISLAQLAQLMRRSYGSACTLRDRWSNTGWVESRSLTTTGPAMLWLTREGVRVAQSPFRPWRPNPSLATHLEAVTSVRLLLERQLSLGEWHCERELAQGKTPGSQRRPHLPDGLLDTGSAQIAIEVELTSKGRSRLSEIFADVSQRYGQVWYFATPKLVPTLGELADAAPWQNVTVYPYPPRPGDLFA